jgi:uncharacterized protein (DUF1501 family)
LAQHSCRDFRLTRRRLLHAGLGLGGLSLAELLALRRAHATSAPGAGRATSCIVFFSWGGVSQLETFDPKPDAPREFRGDYRPIATRVPGIRVGEYMPLLATQTHRLAIVRSVHHPEAGHRNAAYWNLTGHAPHTPGNDQTILPSRRDWPCLGAMVARFRPARAGMPGNVCIPYPIADRGLVNGQDAGFLGMTYDPVIVRPAGARPYNGVSPSAGAIDLGLPAEVTRQRMDGRQQLLDGLQQVHAGTAEPVATRGMDHYHRMATDLLTSPPVSAAFDVERETDRVRDAYGRHMCGQSALLARRLTEAGVPLVTVYSSVGDLNGSAGDNWDTHGNNFNRLRNDLLPPLERASVALLNDLAARGRLDETLVVWLTEFGRTPRLNGGAGRDHFPNVYSVAFAGGGVRGGQVYGASDRIASAPAENGCTPADLHATIFHALGISAEAHVQDNLGRPLALTSGQPLPLF